MQVMPSCNESMHSCWKQTAGTYRQPSIPKHLASTISTPGDWCYLLPRESVTYHAMVAVRYPGLCREVNGGWELGSFASGGIPTRPPGFQMALWDTNPSITGLVAADLEAIVGEVIPDFADSIEYADGLFVMTTATDHKNNLNRTGLKRDNARRLRVETIANSAGGTAQVAIVAQPSTGFLNGRFYADKTPTEDTEDCLGRTTVGLTRSKSLTILVSPLDMLGLMGMAQVVDAIHQHLLYPFCLLLLFFFSGVCFWFFSIWNDIPSWAGHPWRKKNLRFGRCRSKGLILTWEEFLSNAFMALVLTWEDASIKFTVSTCHNAHAKRQIL